MLVGGLGARDRILDRGEPFGVSSGMAQSFCHQECDELKTGRPGLVEFVEPACSSRNPVMTSPRRMTSTPTKLRHRRTKGQCMSCLMVEQHGRELFRRS